jgi:hypothetical protein
LHSVRVANSFIITPGEVRSFETEFRFH